ncbi:hypothetical protein AK830_g10647 [Neonectria ditissima]|uniref:FAD-binding PCMH-type domain-containing protein n=1 Tax=Neonectria ditissima TaxID=78410 RepID=A0A0P7B374_9HYPO|nr:hypothetical protein AK830_g10647 [Neonectria ditissima]
MDEVGYFKSKKIPVHTPGETEYERAVATANLLYRFARPACVVQPEHNFHVRAVVKQAKLKGVPLRIKNGGHSYAGFSTINEGILLDLVNMKRVDLDIESKTVSIQGGALWGHVYKELVNEHHDGYIINGGRCPTVGVSGFILGGGLGPFTRSFGMGSDTLQEATIVTADGTLVTVKDSDARDSNAGRLFWALCGAGAGNFGVLVEMKMRVQQLKGVDVVAGRFTWSPSSDTTTMDTFMQTMNTFYTTDWPDRTTIDSSWLCDLQKKRDDCYEPAVRFLVYHDGTKSDFDEVIDKHLGKGEVLAEQLKRRSMEEKSTRFLHETLVTQWSEETTKAFPSNPSYSIYTSFVFKNKASKIQKMINIIRDEMKAFGKLFEGEQGLLQVTWIHSGGEASRKHPEAAAFRWRECNYHAYIMIQWQEKWLERDMRTFLQKFNLALRKHSMAGRATFINFPDEALTKEAHEKAYFGHNHLELREVKKIWDKDNFFRWPQSIQLPQPEPEAEAKAFDSEPRIETFALMTPSPADLDGYTDVAAKEDFNAGKTLTDKIAGRQWNNFEPLKTEFVGGIQGLTDLGF